MKRIALLLIFISFGTASTTYSDSFEDGLTAYTEGFCKKAFRTWYMLNHRGNAKGREGLALIYLQGCDTDPDVDALKDVTHGIEILKRSNQPLLIYKLGKFLETTRGTYRNKEQALVLLKRAHGLGVDRAAIDIHRILRQGGCEYSECTKWRDLAIRIGDNVALCESAFDRLKNGIEPAKDNRLKQDLENCPPDRRTDALRAIADSLVRDGRYEEALDIYDSIAGTEDITEEVKLRIAIDKAKTKEKEAERQMILAKSELDDASGIRGRCDKAKQYLGDAIAIYKTVIEGAPQQFSIEESRTLLGEARKQIQKDNSWCNVKIASLTITIELVREQYKKGLYTKAYHNCRALLGKHEAECRYFLGLMHLFGQGVDHDRAEALYHLNKSQNLKYHPAWLGLALYHRTEPQYAGLDKAEKLLKSFLLKKGVSLNNRGRALYLLGQIEEDRQEDPFQVGHKSYIKALKYYRGSTEYNYWPAFSAIGELYHKGRVFSLKRYIRAFEYFTVAAENGVPNAQYRMCQYYFEGKGTKTNSKKSKIWCRKALENGIVDAAKFLD